MRDNIQKEEEPATFAYRKTCRKTFTRVDIHTEREKDVHTEKGIHAEGRVYLSIYTCNRMSVDAYTYRKTCMCVAYGVTTSQPSGTMPGEPSQAQRPLVHHHHEGGNDCVLDQQAFLGL